MSETAKERIKRKKKEREKLMKDKSEVPPKADTDNPPLLDTPPKAESAIGPIEVLGIYPASQIKKKLISQGHVCIKIHQLGLEIRNIPYGINKDHDVKIQPPFKYHGFPDEPGKPHKYVESIAFDNLSLWENACELIKAAVLEHHKEELSKAKEENPDSLGKEEGPDECTKE